MSRKPTIIDKIIRSSPNPNVILKNAILNLTPEMLRTFISVSFDKYPVKISDFSKIERRGIYDNLKIMKYSALEGATNEQLINITLGVLDRNKEKIKFFIEQERRIYDHVNNDKYDQALAVIDETISSIGSSIWAENARQSVISLSGKSYNLEETRVQADSLLGVLLNFYNTSLLFSPEESIVDDTLSQLNSYGEISSVNHVKYRVLGFNSKANINYFDILQYEMSTTVIDLYKAFEGLSLNAVSNDIFLPNKLDCVNFLKYVNHHIFSRLDDFDYCRFLSKSFDDYTFGNYQSVINNLNSDLTSEFAEIYLLSNSLKNLKFRLVSKNRVEEICNLLADITEKGTSFKSAKILIENKQNQFNKSVLTFVISKIIMLEAESSEFEDRVKIEDSLLHLSQIPIARKKIIGAECAELYSDTEVLFKDVSLNFKGSIYNKTKIFAKYIGKSLIKDNRQVEALDIYKEHMDTEDCSFRKDIICALVRSGDVISASKYFIKCISDYPNSLDFWYSDELRHKLTSSTRYATVVEVVLTLFYLNEVKQSTQTRKAISLGIRVFTRSKLCNHPSEIHFDDTEHLHVSFLERVCNREFLAKSMLYKYQRDAFDERIRICNLLSSRKLGNKDKLNHEAKELSKKQVLDDASKHISSTKVYADLDYVRTNTWEDFAAFYDDFSSGNTAVVEIEKQLELANDLFITSQAKQGSPSSLLTTIMSKQIKHFLAIGKDKTLKNLYNMLDVVIDEYCFGVRGINSYLSTRIRHGTLDSTLSTPLSESGLLIKDRSDEINRLLSEITLNVDLQKKIAPMLQLFSDEYNSCVYSFINERVQVKNNVKGADTSLFVYSVDTDDLGSIVKSIGDNFTIKDCWEKITAFLLDRTSAGCKSAQQEITEDVSRKINMIVSSLLESVSGALRSEDPSSEVSFRRKIDKVKRDINQQIQEIKHWFDVDYTLVNKKYDLDVAFDITEKMIGFKLFDREEGIPIQVTNSILSPLVDVFHNVAINAISHSNIDNSALKVNVKVRSIEGRYEFIFVNGCDFDGDLNLENSRLRTLVEMDEEQIRERLQNEGGTGIAKILGTLKHDLKSDSPITIKYLSKKMFEITVLINKEAGIYEVSIG